MTPQLGARGGGPTPSRSLSGRDRCALRDYCTRQNFYLSNGGEAGRSMDVKNHQTFSNFSFFVFTCPKISSYVHHVSWNEFMHTCATISLELRNRNNKLTHGRCLKTRRVLLLAYRDLNTFFAHVPACQFVPSEWSTGKEAYFGSNSA